MLHIIYIVQYTSTQDMLSQVNNQQQGVDLFSINSTSGSVLFPLYRSKRLVLFITTHCTFCPFICIFNVVEHLQSKLVPVIICIITAINSHQSLIFPLLKFSPRQKKMQLLTFLEKTQHFPMSENIKEQLHLCFHEAQTLKPLSEKAE